MIIKKNPAEYLVRELEFKTSKSSGPGGQNVNKVNSRVELRFNIAASELLSETEKSGIMNSLAGYISLDGTLTIVSQKERSQFMNKKAVLVKFNKLILKALTPKKIRKVTVKPMTAVQKRLDIKRKVSERKARRKLNED